MPLLSIAIWLPIAAGVLLLAFGRDDRANAVRWSALIAALPLERSVSRTDLRLFLMGALNWSQTWYRDDGTASPAKIARRFVGLLKSGLAEKMKEPA